MPEQISVITTLSNNARYRLYNQPESPRDDNVSDGTLPSKLKNQWHAQCEWHADSGPVSSLVTQAPA
jgi:hypothetical protein